MKHSDRDFRREPRLTLEEFVLFVARVSFGTESRDLSSPLDHVCCEGAERYRLGTYVRQQCSRQEYDELVAQLCAWKASNGKELVAPKSPTDDFFWAGDHEPHDHIPLRLLLHLMAQVLAPNFRPDVLPPDIERIVVESLETTPDSGDPILDAACSGARRAAQDELLRALGLKTS